MPEQVIALCTFNHGKGRIFRGQKANVVSGKAEGLDLTINDKKAYMARNLVRELTEEEKADAAKGDEAKKATITKAAAK
jgi:hypothetical protein